MVKRNNNQLPQNLPQLQNLIKRDPQSYKDEFMQQHMHYKSLLSIFQLHPNQYNKGLDDLIMFMAQVAQCYPDIMNTYAQELINILQAHNSVLDADMRMSFCRALILLRNKNLLAPTDLLSLFFSLLRSQDKALRTFLETHIVNDIKNVNAKSKNAKLNSTLQNFMYSMLNDSNSKAAKMSMDIMIDLYKKNVWNDVKTVNVIATGCFSKITKVMVAALKFFLSVDNPEEKNSDDSDSDNEPSIRDVMMANKVNKKTRKREKQLKKVKQLVQKERRKKNKAPVYNFSALHLLHDPQGMAEKLFRQLQSSTERFEVKVITLDVISRLIGIHELVLLNFYPYIQRFLQPHQREVTKLLQFVAQASHELVPPDALEPILRTLVNNFVSERNTSDVMAIGLNAVREMCARCPLVMNEELLRDLVQYKHYRERSVMMAAKSLIHLYRNSLPEMLHKKDRGRPTLASIEIKAKKFGEINAKDFVPGAEVLVQKSKSDGSGSDDDGDDSDGSWVDIHHSSDELDETADGGDENNEAGEWEDVGEDEADSDEDEEEDDSKIEKNGELGKSLGTEDISKNEGKQKLEGNVKMTNEELVTERSEKAKEVSLGRLLTDEDFQKIDAALIKKKMTNVTRGVKRPAEDEPKKSELVSLGDIENIYKKRKNTKEDRIMSIRSGQEGREKFGFKDNRQNPFSSKTNREKRKNKNFMMLRHKARGKVKRSFKDKQVK
ncbi:hypothetical protein AAG570_008811 [Ranatra chinensis]|uniref:Protein SDA1 n=1 Tax=Ranatra chinensis TaxID=642074 RepID=A0ABD0ZFA0_9HEMI